MEQAKVLGALKKLRESPKRKFLQSIELVICLKELDIKKDEGKIEEFIMLPAGRGKPAKVCGLVGPELKDAATKYCDSIIVSDDFDKLDKRKIRKLARNNDFFIAQANIMPAVAKTFARLLSPSGKMPNLKAGHIVAPKANIELLVNSLRKTIKLTIKKVPVLQGLIGIETMSDEDLAKNLQTVLERIKARLPKGEHNIKNIVLKASMGPPIKL